MAIKQPPIPGAKALSSSHIKAVDYDPATKTLEIEFSAGHLYRYSGVTAADYDGMTRANSLGKYFHKTIKPAYRAKRLKDPAYLQKWQAKVDRAGLNFPKEIKSGLSYWEKLTKARR